VTANGGILAKHNVGGCLCNGWRPTVEALTREGRERNRKFVQDYMEAHPGEVTKPVQPKEEKEER
jgi:hypothetical protein